MLKQDIPDFLLRPIFDTVFVAKATDPGLWVKYGPLIAAFLVFAGWFAVAWLTRRNQLKAFHEGVLDKLRIELNEPMKEYQKWLFDTKDVFASIDLTLPPPQPTIFSKGWREDRNMKLSKLFSNEKIPRVFDRFSEYSLLLPSLVPIVKELHRRNGKMMESCADFFQDIDITNNPNFLRISVLKINRQIMMIEQLRFQFFQFLQYECLYVTDKVSKPNFSGSPLDYIERKIDGKLWWKKVVYSIVSVPPQEDKEILESKEARSDNNMGNAWLEINNAFIEYREWLHVVMALLDPTPGGVEVPLYLEEPWFLRVKASLQIPGINSIPRLFPLMGSFSEKVHNIKGIAKALNIYQNGVQKRIVNFIEGRSKIRIGINRVEEMVELDRELSRIQRDLVVLSRLRDQFYHIFLYETLKDPALISPPIFAFDQNDPCDIITANVGGKGYRIMRADSLPHYEENRMKETRKKQESLYEKYWKDILPAVQEGRPELSPEKQIEIAKKLAHRIQSGNQARLIIKDVVETKAKQGGTEMGVQ